MCRESHVFFGVRLGLGVRLGGLSDGVLHVPGLYRGRFGKGGWGGPGPMDKGKGKGRGVGP